MSNFAAAIAAELSLRPAQVRAALELLAEGNTIPFIARYRKEATGELDEVQLRDLRDRNEYLVELEDRREAILRSVGEQGALSDELRARLLAATTKAELEDLYRPYRPKRRTRAMIAAERGLTPLADAIWRGEIGDAEAARRAEQLVRPEAGLDSVDAVLAGARDILAERVADDAGARSHARELTRERGTLESKVVPGQEEAGAKFRDYFAFAEPVRSVPSHRILAIRRGEAEEVLAARIAAPDDEIVAGLLRRFVAGRAAAGQLGEAVRDAYRRLLAPSVEVELRMELKTRADEAAIDIFGQNLEGLLLAPPAGGRATLGVDPGFRTGCKLAVIGPTGGLLATGLVYLHQEDRARQELRRLVETHGVELVAVGNGTAGRESEKLARDAVRDLPAERRPAVVVVNEAGASVYSASDLAREELPELDLTHRSAVSIARRLQDPLAELVKIDPKSIGVGQYQHDVAQNRLKRRLDETVESCVNRVGVEVNTASPALLGYVSGIGPATAQRIVEYRDGQGGFGSRRELLKVPGLGAKTFQQAAGFLRLRESAHPLDGSAVHPERYSLVERMAKEQGTRLDELVGNETAVRAIPLERYVDDEVGLPTLRDILAELLRPGRDPRSAFEAPAFRDDVQTMEDLREGMRLDGVVTNVVAFGAFVDVGVHQDGLVHLSELSDRYVTDPAQVVRVGQRVSVRVVGVDLARRRIALSMKSGEGRPRDRRPPAREAPAPTKPMPEGQAPNGMRIRRGR